MKKLNLVLGILIGLMIFSCSSDSNDEPQLTLEELLIQGSPWTFSHYEMLNIIDAGNSSFDQADIENDINQNNNGEIVTFNNDGTGSDFIPNHGTDLWNWEIINGNQLKITFDGGNSDVIENISTTSSQMIIEIESVSYDEQAQYEVLHNGKYIYE
jgi:hypothetical protein